MYSLWFMNIKWTTWLITFLLTTSWLKYRSLLSVCKETNLSMESEACKFFLPKTLNTFITSLFAYNGFELYVNMHMQVY